MKIWNKITNEPWATTSDTLENIINIAKRQNANPAAIAAQLGRKLQSTYAVSVRNNVAVIPIHGPLFRYANLFTLISGATSYELLARDFNSALADESIKAILFDIDSPGGEVNGCSELADMIYNARGNVDYLHTDPPEYSDENIDGAPPIRVASIPIIIEFVSNNPLL